MFYKFTRLVFYMNKLLYYNNIGSDVRHGLKVELNPLGKQI